MSSFALLDEETRRKVFWLLQRGTSVALWSRMAREWRSLTDVYAHAVQTWPGVRPERLNANVLSHASTALSLFETGVDALKHGRRDVWQLGGALYQAKDEAALVQEYFYIDTPDFENGTFYGIYPPAVDALFQILVGSLDRFDNAAMEVDFGLGRPAHYPRAEAILSPKYYQYPLYKLPYPVFPVTLAALPPPSDTLIASGERAPVDGIWEPVEAVRRKKLGLFRAGYDIGQPLGCFNYIVAGARAPKFHGQYDASTGDFPIIDVHWRLLWEDRRYVDGVIPDESDYLVTVDPATIDTPPEDAVVEHVFSETGATCPVSGNWAVLEFSGKPIRIEAGARMPEWLVDEGAVEKKAHWVRWRLMRQQR